MNLWMIGEEYIVSSNRNKMKRLINRPRRQNPRRSVRLLNLKCRMLYWSMTFVSEQDEDEQVFCSFWNDQLLEKT